MLNAMTLIVSLQPFIGVSEGELEWSIANSLSPNSSPNVLSELQYQDIKSTSAGIRGQIELEFVESRWSLLAEGELSYDLIYSGRLADTDYFGDNRTNAYSLSISDIEGENLKNYEASIGLGYHVIPGRFSIAILGGGFHKEQYLNFQNGTQIVADQSFFFPATINDLNQSLAELDSDYMAQWRGYWLAVEAEYHFQNLSIVSRLRADGGTYYGEGRWNLRANLQQPKSFTHHADSNGWQWELGMEYELTETLAMQFMWVQGKWESDPGIDRTYLINDTVQVTRLNQVSWQSSQARIGLSYLF